MRRALCWIDLRIGYRGSFLLALAAVDHLYALSLLFPPDPIPATSTLHFLRGLAPLPAWAALWQGVGVVCGVAAFSRRRDWPGFAAAALLKLGWITVLLVGWLFAGYDRAWVAAAQWALAGVLVVRIASWPEPARDEGGQVVV